MTPDELEHLQQRIDYATGPITLTRETAQNVLDHIATLTAANTHLLETHIPYLDN